MQAENSIAARTWTGRSTKILTILAANHSHVAHGPKKVGGLRCEDVGLVERCHLGCVRIERHALAESGAFQIRVQSLVVAAPPAVAHTARALHVSLDAQP
eukprot:3316429-Rhodomonas_salina.1